MKHICKMTVQEIHLDSFGHMNNATYLQILEQARWDMITERGFGLKDIHHHKKGPVILEVNVKFLKELKLREPIEIHTFPEKMVSKIAKLRQEIRNSNNQLACEAFFTVGFFDLVDRKLISPIPEWNHALGFEP
jgi:thioesterase-3